MGFKTIKYIKVKGKFYHKKHTGNNMGCRNCAFEPDELCRQAGLNIMRTYFKGLKYKDLKVDHTCRDSIWIPAPDMTDKQYAVELVISRLTGDSND